MERKDILKAYLHAWHTARFVLFAGQRGEGVEFDKLTYDATDRLRASQVIASIPVQEIESWQSELSRLEPEYDVENYFSKQSWTYSQ